ncbi:PREDICTED: plectin-like, partial [Mesitornis unicolor]|uniref:plectin-like n=1 Tax=Mesitornis unicolor TaxID=54374 RepID=UPI00052884D9
LRDLEGINKSLKYYKDTYNSLDTWIQQVEDTQRKMQETHPENSKALAKQLNQHRMLVSEIEMKQSKIDECQKYSEQYSAAVKDYELQTMTYRAMVDSQQKSPVKRRRMQSSSDFIIQEFMDLRTRYTALVTLMTQYIKFAGDSLKRLEEEEALKSKEASVREAYSDLMARQNSTVDENRKLMGRVKTLEEMLEDVKKQKLKAEQELPKVRAAAEKELKQQQRDMDEICLQKSRAEQEARQCRVDLESVEKEKADAEQELERVRQRISQAESQRSILEENLRAFRIQIEESTFTRRSLEEHLRRKDTNLHDLEQQKKALMQELEKKTEGEEKLMKLVKQMEQDLEFQGNLSEIKLLGKEQSAARRQVVEGRYCVTTDTSTAGQDRTGSEMTSFQRKQDTKKVEELKQKVDELTLANKKADKAIKDLKYELNEVELQKSSSEEKSRLLKEKLDKVNSELKCLKIKLEEKDQAEQGYLQQLKELDKQLLRTTGKAEEVMQEAMDLKKIKMSYQEELERTQLRREVEELTRSQTKTEITVKHLHAQISSLQKEKLAAEQRTQSCKGEANHLQDQYKKIQEQLLQKTKIEAESHQEIQMLRSELAKSNQVSETLQRKIEDLNKWNTETKLVMKRVQSESEKMALEKQSIQRKNDALKALADGFKEQLRTTNEQLHKQTIIEQEFMCKIKSLEVELAKTKELASEYRQKYEKQSASTLTIDQEVKSLSAQTNALTMEKRANEQKLQLQQAHVQELSSKLKKLQDELHQKTLDEQTARKKMVLFQEESIKFKHSAEEFRKKVEKLLESHSTTEKDISGVKLECVALQQEKQLAEENMMLYKVQVEELQERLRVCQEQLQQGTQAELDRQQRCRRLEEELEAQKRAVESLRLRLELQGNESDHQPLMFVQQNGNLQDSGLKWSCERAGSDFHYLSGTAAREFERLPPHAKPGSPLLRQKQERSGLKSDQIEESRVYVSADDVVPRELQFQMSAVNQALEEDARPQSFTEFVSQMSTQFQITFDKASQISGTSERDTLINRNLHSSRQNVRHGEDVKHELGAVKLHPLEIVKNMRVEVTALNQEHDKTFGHEERLFEGYKASEGFRREDFAKMSSVVGEEMFRAVDDAAQVEHFTEEYDNIKFRGLRRDVSARQLAEVRLLDRPTVEQLISGQKTLEEVQKSLDRFLTKPTAVAGLYLESSKEILSFASAAKRRLIGKALALAFLEAQAATGFIIDPSTGQTVSVDESLGRGLVDNEFRSRLLEAEKAVLGYRCSGKLLSVYQAMDARLLDRQKGKNILEAQIASGGVIDPVRSVRVPPETAVQLGLVNNTILKFLHEPSSNAKCFHNPNSRKEMYYCDLLKLCVFSLSSQCFLLPVGERKISSPSAEKSHKISVVDVGTGAEMTSYEAYKKNCVDRATYLELSEQEFDWKESTCFDSDGNSFLLLTDLKTGVQLNIEEALNQGRISRALVNTYKEGLITANEFGDILVSSSQPKKDVNSPIAGFWLSETNQRITVLKASRKNLVDRVTALRCLEAQVSTGGIIDPFTGKRYSVSEALRRELIDEGCARQVRQCELVFTGPAAAVEGVHVSNADREMGLRCLEYQHLTGGLVDPTTRSRLTMEDAIKSGVVDAVTATKMQDEKSYVRVITCPKTKKKLTYKEALERAVFDCHTGLRLLEAAQPLKTGISSLYYSS